MFRPRSTKVVQIVTASWLALFAAACSSVPEEDLLANYFRALRFGDTQTAANIALVSYDASERGVVQGFSVESVGEEQSRPVRVGEYSQALIDAQAADKEFSARKQEYQDENFEAIERVLEAEQAGEEVGRQDQEVQEAWTQWREEMAQHAQDVSDARAALSEERVLPEASLFNPSAADQVDVTQLEGVQLSKEVTILATVRMPDDTEVEKTMRVMMERVEGQAADGTPLSGRWIISSIEDVG